uniref:Large ribosomal subunit protein mL64 n=1 Tax=Acartia pacifica TaxID=335913 RepID=A0A0U2KD84_ACAPC|nr:growth arrest and DNA-damage-inducible proteins-interacting protein 1 [Acartia pacifica]
MQCVRDYLRVTLASRSSLRPASSWNPFTRGSNKADDVIPATEETAEMEAYEKQIETMEREAHEEYIKSRCNKSRLSASHRQMMHGQPPNVGIAFQYSNEHRSRKFRGSMLGRYGAQSTGISPGEMWPTKLDREMAKEWESLYQPAPLKQMIEESIQAKENVKKMRLEREQKIEDNFKKYDAVLSAWEQKVRNRELLAEREQNRRKIVLAELREEFGYDINPEDATMKERILEREKVLLKEERELKKKMRLEKKQENVDG